MQVQPAYRYSRHAICRLAQRGISAEAMRLLLECGETYNAGKGCSYVQLSRADLRSLAAEALLRYPFALRIHLCGSTG